MKLGPLEIKWHRSEFIADIRIMKMISPEASWLGCFLACLYIRTPLYREKVK